MRILIVRLGALGDIVHALPVASALRDAFPDARIDWVVDERHREVLDLVPVIDRRIVFRSGSVPAWRGAVEVVRELRRGGYDVAIDVQGLVKSAFLARASRAGRVVGFPTARLRERAARLFYTETHDPGPTRHVIEKNLGLVAPLGVASPVSHDMRFPIEARPSTAPAIVRRQLGLGERAGFALMNPGAAWPNKRWPPERLGAVALWLHRHHALPSAVLWGPGDETLAAEVVSASAGAAHLAPRTSLADLVALARAATLMVSGDTGPLHLAAAVGTPVVGIYGPTHEVRNGPWSSDDLTVSRFGQCECHHRRRCHARRWCIGDVSVAEVIDAVDRRISAFSAPHV